MWVNQNYGCDKSYGSSSHPLIGIANTIFPDSFGTKVNHLSCLTLLHASLPQDSCPPFPFNLKMYLNLIINSTFPFWALNRELIRHRLKNNRRDLLCFVYFCLLHKVKLRMWFYRFTKI